MTVAMHAYGPFAFFCVFTFLGIIYVYFAFPECKGLSMERMEEVFSVPWYKVGKYRVRHEPLPVKTVGGPEGEKDKNHFTC